MGDSDPRNRGAVIDLRHGKREQKGRSFTFTILTESPVDIGRLRRFPRFRSSSLAGLPYLCVALRGPGGPFEERLCLGGREHRLDRVGLSQLDRFGRVVATETLKARVQTPKPRKLVIAFNPEDADLNPARYAWQIQASGCSPGPRDDPCPDTLPDDRYGIFRLRPVRAVGCTGGKAALVRHGSRAAKVVALTFDDGPSDYTAGFLRVLREKDVQGTFFEVGYEMVGQAPLMRRILAQGSEIGNHTMRHSTYPGYADMAATSDRIERLTHFRPCLFRPPGGGVNSAVIAAAGEAGMQTITWDVDPSDWSTPGSAAIYSRIVGAARPGSIILMHDGGGPRGGTLAALPQIIDTLRRRGYRFETVSELLGNRTIYHPYG